MDQSTHDIRRENWLEIVKQCQARPVDTTVKKWLAQNGISEKSYYYWLRKFRKEAYAKLHPERESESTELAFAEIHLPVPVNESDTINDHPGVNSVAVIKCNGITLEVSNDISASLLHKLIQEVSHA